MALGERRQRSQRAAEDLRRRGFFHGKRQGKPTHNNYPDPSQIGSAAYRRLMAKQNRNNKR